MNMSMSFHMAQDFLTQEEGIEQDKDVIQALSQHHTTTESRSPSVDWSAVEPIAKTIENLANRFHIKIRDVKVKLVSERKRKNKSDHDRSGLELRVPEIYSVFEATENNNHPLIDNESLVFHKLFRMSTADVLIRTEDDAEENWLFSIKDTTLEMDIRDQIFPQEALVLRKSDTKLNIQRIKVGLCEFNLDFIKNFFRGIKIPSVTGKKKSQ